MREIEETAFARGVSAESLMDQAGLEIARAIVQFEPRPGFALIFPGKGNNGGDALVAAKHLAEQGWRIALEEIYDSNKWSAMPVKKLSALEAATELVSPDAWKTARDQPRIIIDGMLGIGSQPGLRDPLRSACRSLNELADRYHARVYAVDLPTGLDGDTGEDDPAAVRADVTVTLGAVKKGLLADGATGYCGRLVWARLEGLPAPENDECQVLDTVTLAGLLPRRNFDSHKTQYGRVGIVAGSPGYTGAARLCAEAAARAGAGLVTIYALEEVYPILAGAVSAEVMVKPVRSWTEALDDRLDALASGPGCGRDHDADLWQLVAQARCPMVVDADALNALADHLELLEKAPAARLLTPHPGEMARLQAQGKKTRAEWATDFVRQYRVTLLLKGARTLVAQAKKPLAYNTTGNPGMGSGGMGDVLTGVCVALLGQGLSPYTAARLGAWLCGRAAEAAIASAASSPESLVAPALCDHLGDAFTSLRQQSY